MAECVTKIPSSSTSTVYVGDAYENVVWRSDYTIWACLQFVRPNIFDEAEVEAAN